MKILFVCTGNACRSVLGEGYMKALVRDNNINSVEIISCGIAANPAFKTPKIVKTLLEEKKISLPDHVSTQVNKILVNACDLILAMENIHRKELLKRYPESKEKIFLLKEFAGEEDNLDIPDPIGRSDGDYVGCALEIEKFVKKSFDNLVSMGRIK